jgi:hypothetical protein
MVFGQAIINREAGDPFVSQLLQGPSENRFQNVVLVSTPPSAAMHKEHPRGCFAWGQILWFEVNQIQILAPNRFVYNWLVMLDCRHDRALAIRLAKYGQGETSNQNGHHEAVKYAALIRDLFHCEDDALQKPGKNKQRLEVRELNK